MLPLYLHMVSNKPNAAIAHALSILQGCVKPAPSRQQARPNAELESQNRQCKMQACRDSQLKEQWDTNGMDNSKFSLRIRATAHSQLSPNFTIFPITSMCCCIVFQDLGIIQYLG
jgi:hypothetical protein